MPDVHFIGEIQYVTVDSFSQVSLTFAFVPGSLAWYLKGGACHGETHTATRGEQDCLTLNYPLDAHYDASSAEGWPFFVCELWDKSSDGVRSFIGCGATWLPSSGVRFPIDVCLWRPTSAGLGSITEMLLPTCPDLRALRELTVSPYLRSQIQVETVGSVKLTMNTVTAGFEEFGVKL